jgi:cytoskeletal protein RodZ
VPGKGQRFNLPPLGLEENRRRAGVTLEQIADSTKISKRFLSAIEQGEYGELPGGVFTTSYIRQYADATGYDAAEILEHLRKSTEPQAELKPVRRDEPGRPEAGPGLPKWAMRLFTLG